MKKHKGLYQRKIVILHGIQQLSAFIAFMCCFIILLFSIAGLPYSTQNNALSMVSFRGTLFSPEKKFENTGYFDDTLIKAIKEIIRYNVAKSQLETDGQFDDTKIIDIDAFVNRKKSLQSGMDYVTESNVDEDRLAYYLGDLIKWNKYGIFTDRITLSETEFVTFFGDRFLDYYDGNLTQKQKDILNAVLTNNAMLNVQTKENLEKNTQVDKSINENTIELQIIQTDDFEMQYVYSMKVRQALADILEQTNVVQDAFFDRDSGKIYVTVALLEERYHPVGEDSLLSYAKSWFEYETYIENIIQAVEDLSYNYSEYLVFKERYDQESSNIKYTFKMTMMGQPVEVDNLDTKVPNDKLDEYYKSHYGKYMIYRPQTMYFESNTGIINENMLFEIFSYYEYAYPETAQIWIAVNTDYPTRDIFALSSEIYEFLHSIIYVIMGLGIVSVCMWIILLLYLSVKTGYPKGQKEENVKVTLYWFDLIPTEIILVICGVISFIAALFLYEYGENVFDLAITYSTGKRLGICVRTAGIGMVLSILVCIFWYSFLRKLKAHTFWRNSLLYRLWKSVIFRLLSFIKRTLIYLYDSMNIWLRGFIYISVVMLFNFVLGILAYQIWREEDAIQFIALILIGIILGDGFILTIWIHNRIKQKKIVEGIKRIRDGEVHYQVSLAGMHGDNRYLAEAVNSIGEGIKTAVETSMKDERLKADLITNVSHDIKTPLTSIINYVNLLKRENIQTQPEKGYIEILDSKSQRLKQLTDDLLEASKISSGNIILNMEKINLVELINQSIGEFVEKFEEKKLFIINSGIQEPVYIMADSRRIWRVIENLFHNIYKYALDGTRVYIDLIKITEESRLRLSVKNISAQPLNIQAEELTERFIRGDVSRNTEGSGLGLSIAKNLTELQHGIFDIYLDGDLFKVTLEFPIYEETDEIDV